MPRRQPTMETRRAIVDTAARMVVRNGWDRVRVADVVAELGVTRGAFYPHFDSRQALVLAVLVQQFLEDTPLAKPDRLVGSNALEKLRSAVTADLAWPGTSPLPEGTQALLSEPGIFLGSVELEVTTRAPLVARLLVEGNADGSTDVARPDLAAEALGLLMTTWMNLPFEQEPAEKWAGKVAFLAEFCRAQGFDLVDDALRDTLLALGPQD